MKEAIGEKKFGRRKIVFWDFLNGTKTFFEVSVWVSLSREWSRRGLEDGEAWTRPHPRRVIKGERESGDLNVISGFPALMRI